GFSSDSVTLSSDPVSYSDRHVAYDTAGQVTNKPIAANNISISGTDAANYAPQATSTSISFGRITPKPLAVSGVTAVDRVYDGTRDVVVNISSATVDTTAILPIDQGQIGVATPSSGTVTGQMADKNVGTNKPITVPGLTLTGAAAGDYTITSGSG